VGDNFPLDLENDSLSRNPDKGVLYRRGILMNSKWVITHHSFWILCGILYLAAGLTDARGAEVSGLVMNTDQGYLMLSVKIRDVIAGEVSASPEAEASATIIFSIALYEVKPFWFDKKMAHHTATNTIKHDPQKNEYRLLRSWDNGPLPVVDSLNQARLLMTEVNNLKLMPLVGLEKGRNYQIRVQAVCQDKNAYVFSPTGCFKTDWHTVDFTF
jgi:hypothetical protein